MDAQWYWPFYQLFTYFYWVKENLFFIHNNTYVLHSPQPQSFLWKGSGLFQYLAKEVGPLYHCWGNYLPQPFQLANN